MVCPVYRSFLPSVFALMYQQLLINVGVSGLAVKPPQNLADHMLALPVVYEAISFTGFPILRNILLNSTVRRGPGSSVGIATDYGLEVPGSNPGGERFSACLDRPWSPPSLL